MRECIAKNLYKIANKILPDLNYFYSVSPSRPYDYVQTCVVRDLSHYVPDITESKIVNIIIVGAYLAYEVDDFIRLNPKNKFNFTLYEANPETAEKCKNYFKNCNNVKVVNKAISDKTGSMTFYENSVAGTGSLLKLNTELAAASFPISTIKEYSVDLATLDDMHSNDNEIDILWIDVQGNEKNVLTGAQNVLKKVKTVFIEIQHCNSDYKDGALFAEIDGCLKNASFLLLLLGVDPNNKQGNAFYVKN